MRKQHFSLLTLLLFTSLLEISADPAKPGARWWWLGSAVDKPGLKWNMEQMSQCGIGTLEITPLYGVKGNDKNNIPFLSPKWMEMLQYTLDEGKRLGVQIDMNLGTGWPFGGPTTPIDEAACKLVVVDTIVPAKEAKTIDLLAPAKEKKYATKILQRAYPAKKGEARVIALFQSRTRQKVKRAAPGGEGWVIDHFDSTAVAHYLKKFDDAFAASKMTAMPATFFNDSYEVYQADWTPTLLKEFKARRGYALEDKLPEFIDGDPQVISDYRETLSDLLLKNFTEQWVSWSHKHGVKVRNQAHGSPANLIDVYAAVDIPEIEGFGLSEFGIKGLRKDPGFTKKNFSDLSMLKYASSAAHITGKPYTSSETFTWLTEHFRTSLSQMKPDLDLMFCSGVNRMFFHGACYSPKDDPWPGWRFYASVDMSPTNSIWRDAPALMKYIKYCQARLQEGQPDNDLLVLLPVRNMWRKDTKNRLMQFDIHSMDKKAPEFIADILKIDSLGYDCDYISEKYLLTTSCVDGKLQTAAGTRYAALILPEGCILSPAAQKHIDNLKAAGANIIYNIKASELNKVAKPEELRTRLHVKMIRRSTSTPTSTPTYQYFISNLTPNDIDDNVTLAATGEKVNLKLRSGESCFILTNGKDEAYIDYPVSEMNGQNIGLTEQGKATEIDLTNQPWTLRFIECAPQVTDKKGQSATFKLPKLQTWENGLPGATAAQNDSIKELMGTGVYETTFKIGKPVTSHSSLVTSHSTLSLGDLRESARVYINDKYVGTAWCVPYDLPIPAGILKAGKNTLRIEVTNLPANRIAAYDRKGIQWRKFNEINVVDLNYKRDPYSNWAPVPSGLNSNVKIILNNK